MKKIILVLIVMFALMSCETNNDGIKERHDFFTKMKYRDQGNSIGRKAMLMYLSRTNQLKDSITIELDIVLDIEDSLTIEFDKN